MSQTIATYERVSGAVRKLIEVGETPTAGRVMALIRGGSKTTVLGHLKRVFEEQANGTFDRDDRQRYLASLVEPLISKIVADAERDARAEVAEQLSVLTQVNAGLTESLDELRRDLEAESDRALIAEARVARLEADLAARVELQEHLAQLSNAVRALKGEPPSTPAMQRHAELLIELTDGPGRGDIHRRMVAEGYTDKVVHAGRAHAVSRGYIEERGSPPRLYVTEKGRRWLSDGNRRRRR